MAEGKTDMMNKTLYTLTLITAIATPLMFLTGLFGMNFDDMDELVKICAHANRKYPDHPYTQFSA